MNFNQFLNDRPIPIVNSVKYLGHSLRNNCNIDSIFNLEPIISDIKTRSNVILSNFYFLSYDSKVRIFNTNCSTFYGCVLANQNSNSLEILDRAWRVACRRLLSLPQRTHCCLIPSLMSTLPPSEQINQRTFKFFFDGLNNSSSFIKFFFENCLNEKSSVMFRNLISIKRKANITLNELLFNGKPKVKFKKLFHIRKDWRAGILRELLCCRDGDFNSILSNDEIGFILNYICLS